MLAVHCKSRGLVAPGACAGEAGETASPLKKKTEGLKMGFEFGLPMSCDGCGSFIHECYGTNDKIYCIRCAKKKRLPSMLCGNRKGNRLDQAGYEAFIKQKVRT